MRVGGRLAEAPLSFEARHPLIVPRRHYIAELIVRYYHIIVAHTGMELSYFIKDTRALLDSSR